MIEIVYWSSCNVPVFVVIPQWNFIFWTVFRKIFPYQISWISVWWELMFCQGQWESQTNVVKLEDTFCNCGTAVLRNEIHVVRGFGFWNPFIVRWNTDFKLQSR